MGQPKPYPGDDYIKQMIDALGYIKPDANRNIIIGQSVTIDGSSLDNIVTAVNAEIRGSIENKLFARNVKIFNSYGVTAIGADHTIGRLKDASGIEKKRESDYATVEGDANTVIAYGSSTKGVGNRNYAYAGVVEGMNCVLGEAEFPNKHKRSSARGLNITVIGSDSHGMGANFTIVGDNIIVIGIGIGQTFREPGVYVLNPK